MGMHFTMATVKRSLKIEIINLVRNTFRTAVFQNIKNRKLKGHTA